ncbi:hypothetical protein MKEN_00182300 [Mycena kentingensis (nom. inval.)]|nr:hypothetical protein MKEN_00182300 [Mycena kentingensis (nom. inval.)]
MDAIARLKQNGNARFSARDYAGAATHYTAAIRAFAAERSNGLGGTPRSPDNAQELAIIFSNRAACFAALERHRDARNDAEQATKLDPNYAKAFARLAAAQTALGEHTAASASWARAVELVPAEDTHHYHAALEAALEKFAATMLPALSAQRTIKREHILSSAWVIHAAYDEFSDGARKMGQLVARTAPNGSESVGMLGAIIATSNGILRDWRVMHLHYNLENLERQILFEARTNCARSWIEFAPSPEQVIVECIEQQAKDGWDNVQRAVSYIIRVWIIRGQADRVQHSRVDTAIANCRNCLLVIRALRETWPVSDWGRIIPLEDSFLFGVQALYLEMLIQATPDAMESNELLQEAVSLLSALDAQAARNAQSQLEHCPNPSFLMSFVHYPRGIALCAQGLVASLNATRASTASERLSYYRQAASSYTAAAKWFPEDDERHPETLQRALSAMRNSDAPTTVLDALDVMQRIRVTSLKAQAIWAHVLFPRVAPPAVSVDEIMREEDALRLALEEGRIAGDSPWIPHSEVDLKGP